MSGSARSRSASRLTVIGRGPPSGPNHSDRDSHRSSSQPVSADRSFTSHGSDCQRRLYSGRSISPMFRFRSIISIRLATTSRYSAGHACGISVTGVARCRANHSVSRSPLSTCRASTISKARNPKSIGGTDPGSATSPTASSSVISRVPAVNVPVQLLLERDHPPPNPLMLGMTRRRDVPGSGRRRRTRLTAQRRRAAGQGHPAHGHGQREPGQAAAIPARHVDVNS